MRDDWRGDPSVVLEHLPVKEVELLGVAGSLLTHYKESFNDRYHAYPIADAFADRDVAQWLSKTFEPNHAKALITHYFQMHNKWFVENAHSLSVLRKNINLVLASYSPAHAKGSKAKLADPGDTLHWYLLNCEGVREKHEVTKQGDKLFDKHGVETTGQQIHERLMRLPTPSRSLGEMVSTIGTRV